MSENRPQRLKNENLKTEAAQGLKAGEVELGKPVKLPYIRKISTNATNNPNFSRKSLEGKDTRVMRNSNKELQLLEQTHLNLLTLQEIELCNERSKEKADKTEGFPRILLPNPLFARERSIDSLEHPHRLRSEKSITKLDFSDCLRDYRLGPILGRGTYSVVRVARSREGKKFAVKAYQRSALSSEDRRANLESEINILQTVQHPCIPAYQQTIETEDAIHIVTQLCENRSLADWLREGTGGGEGAARGVARQVGKVLQYLHGLEVVHRDLKLENILVGRQGRLKLIDYGFSRQLPRETFMLYDFCGTPHYIAPQVIQREGYFGKPADMWSLGIILYRMVVGSFPFKGNTEKTLFLKVVKGDLRLPPELSTEFASLMGRMLNFDYRKRPTAQELGKDGWVTADHQ